MRTVKLFRMRTSWQIWTTLETQVTQVNRRMYRSSLWRGKIFEVKNWPGEMKSVQTGWFTLSMSEDCPKLCRIVCVCVPVCNRARVCFKGCQSRERVFTTSLVTVSKSKVDGWWFSSYVSYTPDFFGLIRLDQFPHFLVCRSWNRGHARASRQTNNTIERELYCNIEIYRAALWHAHPAGAPTVWCIVRELLKPKRRWSHWHWHCCWENRALLLPVGWADGIGFMFSGWKCLCTVCPVFWCFFAFTLTFAGPFGRCCVWFDSG